MHHWHAAYQSDMEDVFRTATERIQAYPQPLRDRALAYMKHFDPGQAGSTKNYICYLLPFWVQPAAGIDRELSRRLACANVFVMLYFFIQDDVMDAPPSDAKYQLALGNLFLSSYTELYQQLFPSDSVFWQHARDYVDEWAVSVTTMMESNSFEAGAAKLAGKASPVKMASTGALVLGQQEARIGEVSSLVDEVLATLQMVDDWMDWEEDLREGSDNSFLDFVRLQQDLAKEEPILPEQVNRAIFTSDALQHFAQFAQDRHTALLPWHESLAHLIEFHQSLVLHLSDAHARAMAAKSSLLRGGLLHYLSRTAQ